MSARSTLDDGYADEISAAENSAKLELYDFRVQYSLFCHCSGGSVMTFSSGSVLNQFGSAGWVGARNFTLLGTNPARWIMSDAASNVALAVRRIVDDERPIAACGELLECSFLASSSAFHGFEGKKSHAAIAFSFEQRAKKRRKIGTRGA